MKNINSFDKIIIFPFYISIILLFYYSCVSQSMHSYAGSTAPMAVLLLPFIIAVMQLVRIGSYRKKCRLGTLGRSWLYIFIYYLFAFIVGNTTGGYKYSVYWTIIIPPVTWFYFSTIVREDQRVCVFLSEWGFMFFLIFSAISLYFIPRSILSSGYFASLNTGYFVMLSYPMTLLSKNRTKVIISTVLMLLIVLLSMKRGGFLCVALGFALFFLFSENNKSFGVLKKFALAAMFISALLLLIPVINEFSGGSLGHRLEFTLNQGDEDGRAAMYPLVWKASFESSFFEILLGHGHEAVSRNNIINGLSAHNDYLEFLYDYGIMGLILLLNFQIKIIILTIKSRAQSLHFLSMTFALSCILVLSTVSILYAYQYFLLIIPFLCIMSSKLNTN